MRNSLRGLRSNGLFGGALLAAASPFIAKLDRLAALWTPELRSVLEEERKVGVAVEGSKRAYELQ